MIKRIVAHLTPEVTAILRTLLDGLQAGGLKMVREPRVAEPLEAPDAGAHQEAAEGADDTR